MRVFRIAIKVSLLVLIGAAALFAGGAAKASSAFSTIYGFCSTGGNNCTDGQSVGANLIADGAGNLYGTSQLGGANRHGLVFKLSQSGGVWSESVLYAFCPQSGCADGSGPSGGLIFDQAGNLYGVTVQGGGHNKGAVYKLSPNGGGWTETVLYSFCSAGGSNCTDGVSPYGSLVFDPAGNLYGTTEGGGSNSKGVAFKLSQSGGVWSETVLYSFCQQTGCADGTQPQTGLVLDPAGNLYGTTFAGGNNTNNGIVFKLSQSGGVWSETVLHSFCSTGGTNCTDGAVPIAALVSDQVGNLYGTTDGGGNNNNGVVFRMTQSGGVWSESVLYTFCPQSGCADGSFPLAGLILDQVGNLYGTTFRSGIGNNGVVFKLSPSGGLWTETVLYTFCPAGGGCPDGAGPSAGLVLDQAGNLYGTTLRGGPNSNTPWGTAFEVIQYPQLIYAKSADFNGDGRRDILWRFTDGTVGEWLMNADGSYQAVGFQGVPKQWQIAGTGDFNHDGVTDILWRCIDPTGSVCPAGQVAIWLMNANGTLKQAVGGQIVPVGWTVAGTGDFNLDGVADILWRCTDTTGSICTAGQVVIWLMNTDGTVKGGVGGQVVSTGWTIAGLGDFNADGVTDILWRCTDGTGTVCSAGYVAIWLMNPDGTLKASVGGQIVSPGWTIAGTGDFNADGITDILWRCTDWSSATCPAGLVAIWLMNADGTLKSGVGGQTVPLTWTIAGTGDFNGDGIADILWRYTDGTLGEWLMNADGSIKAGVGGQMVPLGWATIE